MQSSETYIIWLGVLFIIGLSVAILYCKRVSKKINRLANEKILIAEEQAMKKIAEELHDNLAPSILLARMQLEHFVKENKESTLQKSIDQIDTVLEQTRQIAILLHPSSLSELGLQEAIKNLLHQLRQYRNIKTNLSMDNALLAIEKDKVIPLFRIIQESIQNLLKHARATEISICFRSSEQFVCVDILDNGIGFDVNKVRTGAGLQNMQQRTRSLQGQFRLLSKPGHGTHIHLKIPK